MGKRLIVATGNNNKLAEIREILSDIDVEIVSMKEAGADIQIEENGHTFEENAIIKARAVAQASGEMAIADDSGLVIDALGGDPGIYSARFMGRETPYAVKNRALIKAVDDYCREQEMAAEEGTAASAEQEKMRKLRDEYPGCDDYGNPGPLRSARFVCAVAVAWPDGRKVSKVGVMEGRISYKCEGKNGFGFDPIFYLPEYGKTSAQISPDEKNRISHRGQALAKLRALL